MYVIIYFKQGFIWYHLKSVGNIWKIIFLLFYRKYKQPGNILYVGKSTVYLRNKYIFETQPVGIAKKGSKILKVMDLDVYTYHLKILSPETGSTRTYQAKNAVVNLLDGFLDQGRLVIFHNLYVSLDLAQELLKRKCHSIGMIRKNARGTPKDLESKTIQDGELIGYQNSQGISVMKWQLLGNKTRLRYFADLT